jgi:retinol dehydrogenase 12
LPLKLPRSRLGDVIDDGLAGRTYLITGGNTGIGRATAAGLAARGGRVYLACRSPEKGRRAAAEIAAATRNHQVRFVHVDLADLDSVRRCAQEFLATGEPLHALINNAGVGGVRGITRDGFELAFGVNHLGHFALTAALLDRLAASAPSRVVTVASTMHYQAAGVDFDAVRRRTASFAATSEYAVSKLCNVLFSAELARRVQGQGITSYALHPGAVATDIYRRAPWPLRKLMTLRMLSPEQGARTSLYCATADSVAADSGCYYDSCCQKEPSEVATPELARALWHRSEAWAAAALH